MFTDLQNNISTRQLAQGAAECTFDTDLRRGPDSQAFCSLWIGEISGDSATIQLITATGDQVVFGGVTAGTHLPVQVQQVLGAGTTGVAAADIICLY